MRSSTVVATFLAMTLTLTAAAAALAKDDAIVTLDAALPTDPQPGSVITIGWTVESPVVGSALEPFNAEGVFIRLIPPMGDPVEAVGLQDPPGHYIATMTVPSGGLRDVEIGIRGESCSLGTCQRSDLLFVINEPVAEGRALPDAEIPDAAVPHAAVPGGAALPDAGSGGSHPSAVVGLALAAGAIVIALAFIRARGRTLTPRSSRTSRISADGVG
jgi:hypothetical protein